MANMNNCVAVNWDVGPDRIYFFFKDSETYSKFLIGDDKFDSGFPKTVQGRWGENNMTAKNLKFGFVTSSFSLGGGNDHLWLFYDDNGEPSVIKYSQQNNEAVEQTTLSTTRWAKLAPYFDKIVGAMCQYKNHTRLEYWFLLNDGNYLVWEYFSSTLQVKPLAGSKWSGFEPYKDRMVTAVLNDYPTFDLYFYVFLTGDEYLRYEHESGKIHGPLASADYNWPGLDEQ